MMRVIEQLESTAFYQSMVAFKYVLVEAPLITPSCNAGECRIFSAVYAS